MNGQFSILFSYPHTHIHTKRKSVEVTLKGKSWRWEKSMEERKTELCRP